MQTTCYNNHIYYLQGLLANLITQPGGDGSCTDLIPHGSMDIIPLIMNKAAFRPNQALRHYHAGFCGGVHCPNSSEYIFHAFLDFV